jgi:hypothetical protein
MKQAINVDRALRGIAGTVILLSVALAWLVNGIDLTQPSWLWLTAFVGANLLQSAFTFWCPMMAVLRKFGLQS